MTRKTRVDNAEIGINRWMSSSVRLEIVGRQEGAVSQGCNENGYYAGMLRRLCERSRVMIIRTIRIVTGRKGHADCSRIRKSLTRGARSSERKEMSELNWMRDVDI